MNQELWQLFSNKQYKEVLAKAAEELKNTQAFDYIHVAGLSLIGLDNMEQGMDWLCASLALTSPSVDWFRNGATACMEQERYMQAILILTNGLKEYPKDLNMTFMLGLCHVHIHEWAMAVDFFNKALEIDKDFYHARLSIGFCHHMLGLYDSAIEYYESIHDGTPEAMESVYNNHACVLIEQGKPKEALQFLLDKCPGSERPATLYNMSFLYLGLGIWPLGWQLYRYRDTVAVSKNKLFSGNPASSMPKVEQPVARSLHEIHNKHLLMFHEQGLGDTIQFIRYAQKLEKIADRITIGVPKSLHRLAETLLMDKPFKVISSENDVVCDIAIPMLDAPILFETTIKTIPNTGPYFKLPNVLRKRHYLPRMAHLRVGLCWAGASRVDNIRAFSIDKRRSIPFELLDPLLQREDVHFFSLHLSDHHKDHPNLIQILKDNFDMLDTAAIIDQMDLIITIDSSIAHLAGALGKTVWLLSRFDSCWRWGWPESEDDSLYHSTPWYSNTYIFRQKSHNSWPEVLEEVRQKLLSFMK